MLDNFIEKILEIKQASGKNKKKELLLKLIQNNYYREILEISLNPRKPTYIGEETTLKTLDKIEEKEGYTIFSTLLNDLCSEKIDRGHTALSYIKYFLNNTCDTDNKKEICLSLIKKNPRLGISWHSFTKATGINKFEVMLAKDINKVKKINEKVIFPIYIQPKLDGYRAIAKINKNKEWELFSRNGKKYLNFDNILLALEKYGDKRFVYDGEIMSDDFQSMQKTAFSVKNKKTIGDVKYYIFDILSLNDFNQKKTLNIFEKRKVLLENFSTNIKNNTDLLKVVNTIECNSWEEVYTHHDRYIEEGYEGTIVRLNAPYEFKRTDSLMKIKNMKSQDCKIISIIEGKGKFKGMMGAIRVLQEDNQTICETGTGFDDKTRINFWTNKDKIINKIVEIKYQELTPDGVMRFPVFIRFRHDKE